MPDLHWRWNVVWISEVVALGLLLWLALYDRRTLRVPVYGLFTFFGLGLVRLVALERQALVGQCLLSFWVVLCLWLAGRASGHGIGSGDIWLLAALPFWRTGIGLLWTFLIAFFCAAVYGLLRFGIKGRKQQFPFVPWIALGYAAGSIVLLRKG